MAAAPLCAAVLGAGSEEWRHEPPAYTPLVAALLGWGRHRVGAMGGGGAERPVAACLCMQAARRVGGWRQGHSLLVFYSH